MIFLYIIFVLICVLLMVSVLLQAGKGGGLSGTFGGIHEVLGGRGAATFLTKATTTLATMFMLMAVLLSVIGSRTGGSSEEQSEVQRQMQQSAPTEVAPLPNQGQQGDDVPGVQPAPSEGE